MLLARCTDRANYYYAGIASWGDKYAIGVLVDGVNTKLTGVGSASDITPDTTYRLRFALTGSTLSLYDGDQLVASVVDPTLIPDPSYIGLQSSTPTGQAAFANVTVTSAGR